MNHEISNTYTIGNVKKEVINNLLKNYYLNLFNGDYLYLSTIRYSVIHWSKNFSFNLMIVGLFYQIHLINILGHFIINK